MKRGPVKKKPKSNPAELAIDDVVREIRIGQALIIRGTIELVDGDAHGLRKLQVGTENLKKAQAQLSTVVIALDRVLKKARKT